MKKSLLTVCGLVLSLLANAQYSKDDRAQWLDSTLVIGRDCAPIFPIFYYELGVKYPRSSEALLKEVTTVIEAEKIQARGTGYVTFHFFVNCEGKTSRFSVLQTSEDYRPAHFSPDLIKILYDYTRKLDQWPARIEAEGISMLNYFAYVSYKFKDGKPVAIIP